MNQNQNQNQKQKDENQAEKQQKDDSVLERMAKTIAPPSHEVSDDELKDPGKMTPGAPPTKNKS
jgi:hypothetical protein